MVTLVMHDIRSKDSETMLGQDALVHTYGFGGLNEKTWTNSDH